MTSKNVSSLTVVTRSELLAMLKLVQRGNEIIREQWVEDCMISFGWDMATASNVTNNLRRMAVRELAREKLVV